MDSLVSINNSVIPTEKSGFTISEGGMKEREEHK